MADNRIEIQISPTTKLVVEINPDDNYKEIFSGGDVMKFKKPKNGHFNHYCYDCEHYTFERQIGCAYLGRCDAIEGEPSRQDAYDPPCGLWKAKVKNKTTI